MSGNGLFVDSRQLHAYAPTLLVSITAAALSTPAAWAAHPLITEDAYTLGAGVAQLELGFEHARLDQADAHGWTNETRMTLSYGVRENVDLLLGTPYLDTRELSADGIEHARGLADVSLEVKWRLWEKDSLKVAVKPGVTIPSGNFREGLGTGRVVPSVFLVSTWELGAWIWNVHVGYLRNENQLDERRDLLHLSSSVVYQMGPRIQWALDVSADSNVDVDNGQFPAVVVAAAIYSLTESLDLDLGVKAGLNGVAEDYALLAGATLSW